MDFTINYKRHIDGCYETGGYNRSLICREGTDLHCIPKYSAGQLLFSQEPKPGYVLVEVETVEDSIAIRTKVTTLGKTFQGMHTALFSSLYARGYAKRLGKFSYYMAINSTEAN